MMKEKGKAMLEEDNLFPAVSKVSSHFTAAAAASFSEVRRECPWEHGISRRTDHR